MKILKWICLFSTLFLIVSSCQNVTGEVYYRPYATPLTITVNSRGEISLSISSEITLPTPLGTFGIGVVINPNEKFNVENTLTIRMNGQDSFYDLHGQDFSISFESGYYKKIKLQKNGLNILLELERIDGDSADQVQELAQEDPIQFIKNYYSSINNRQYDQAWSLLSDDFIDRNHGNNAGGYSAYVDWWDSVSKVTVTAAEINYQGVESAKVVTVLNYVMQNNYSYEDTVYFQLIYNKSRETWLIDATPTNWNT